MQRGKVESTTVRSVGYECDKQLLEIEFQSGAIYQYLDVPETVYEELCKAESKGRYFNLRIRDDYPFLRLDVKQKRRKASGARG